MKLRIIGVLVFAAAAATVSAQLPVRTGNSIQGHVFDAANRKPVADVYVELLNDTYSVVKRIRTDGSGRFYFGGLTHGRFKVRVLPYATNYREQTQEADLGNSTVGTGYSTDNVYLDFYLKANDPQGNRGGQGQAAVLFVQDVPAEAKAAYARAVANFERPSESDLGFADLKRALELFPDYYDALDKISFEYVKRDMVYESLPYLVKAVGVNQRSFSCHYMLGTVAFRIKQYKEAAEAFGIAAALNPHSETTQIKYGMALRTSGDLAAAEAALKKAVSMSGDRVDPEAHWQLALLYEKQKRYADAARQLEEFLKAEAHTPNRSQIESLIRSFKKKAAGN